MGRNKKKIIIGVMCVLVLLMVVVYAAFMTRLTINGTGNITSTWNIEITSISSNITGTAYNIENPTYNGTNATFNVGLRKPGDKIEYSITIKNNGSVDAIINEVNIKTTGSYVIIYTIEGIQNQERLASNGTKTFKIIVEFDKDATSIPSDTTKELIVDIECIQDDGQQLTPSDPNIDNEDTGKPTFINKVFGTGGVYAYSVESVEFVTSNTVPSDAIDSWSVSSDGTNAIMEWYTDKDNDSLYEVYIGQKGGVKAGENMSGMFSGAFMIEFISFEHLDTSGVINMSNLFSQCNRLLGVDFANIDTPKVTNMSGMFSGCSNLTGADLSGLNTSQVTDMSNMFSFCNSLIDINLGDTSNVIDMSGMFSNCSNTSSFTLNFKTSKVTDMSYMFSGCYNLNAVNFSSFTTENLKNINGMFSDCEYLRNIDIRNATFSTLESYDGVFDGSYATPTIYVKNEEVRNKILTNMLPTAYVEIA